MKFKRIWAVSAVLIPILALVAMTVDKHQRRQQGHEVILPIEGFDPRDLLAGHYLIYQIDYGVKNLCEFDFDDQENNGNGYVRLNPPTFDHWKPAPGELFIQGKCENGRFVAGIERFYIPQEHAKVLDKVVRNSQGKVVVSVFHDGRALVQDLLINDRSWKTFVKDTPS